MADFLDEKRREMQERLKELRPLVDEYHRLEAAVQALDGVERPRARRRAARAAPRPARRRAPARRAPAAAAGPRARARAASRRWSSCATRPGITIPELAEQMGIQQNYLYRVLPGLQKDGHGPQGGPGLAPRA